MKTRMFALLFGLLLAAPLALQAADNEPSFGAGSAPPPEVLKFLQEMKRQYGPDTVALVSWIIEATNHSGSILTSSVKVAGHEVKDNTRFLVFRVETGLILNEKTVDRNSRLLLVWEKILGKAFLQMETIQVPADGVMIDLLYHHKSFPETDSLADHVDEPGPIEEAKFYIHGDALRAFMHKELSAHQLLSRTQVLVDGQPVFLVTAQDAQQL